jgi:Tol biopolymer transport system component
VYDELQNQRPQVWIYDLGTKTRNRITFDPEEGSSPCWSHDGTSVFFNVESGGSKAVIGTKRADGSGSTEIIARGKGNLSAGYYPIQVSPDGRYLLMRVLNESGSQLGTLDLKDQQRPIPVRLLGIAGSERGTDRNTASISPDGRWIAFESSEAGTSGIFVSSFGGQAGKWQVSPGGAMAPIWSKGKIVYWSMALNHNEWVDFKAPGGSPVLSAPKQVFPAGKGLNNMLYGASADGTRYLALRRLNAGSGSTLHVIVNWQGLLNAE